jgi:chromosome segregation ATPase
MMPGSTAKKSAKKSAKKAAKKKAAVSKKKSVSKKSAKKKAAPKPKAPELGILESIRSELEQEYSLKLENLKTEYKNNLKKFKEHGDIVEKELSTLRANRHKYSDIDAKLRELDEKEDSLTRTIAQLEQEREQNVNDVINTRTERMKQKLDDEFNARVAKFQQELLVGLDLQTKKLYHSIAEVLKNSRANPMVMYHTVGLVQQTLLREQRVRLGVDAPDEPEGEFETIDAAE